MALVKRKGPPVVSRHNTRTRKRHIVGRLIDDHAATYLRENKTFTGGKRAKGGDEDRQSLPSLALRPISLVPR